MARSALNNTFEISETVMLVSGMSKVGRRLLAITTMLSLGLLNGCYLPLRYNQAVKCEVRSGDRAIQVVSYDTRPQLQLSAHVGGTQHLEGVKYLEGVKSTWVIEESPSLNRVELCALSSLPPHSAIIFPANMNVNTLASNQVNEQVKRLITDLIYNSTYIVFDGREWLLNAVYATGEEPNPRHSIGSHRLSWWTTTAITGDDGKLIARQVAASQAAVDSLSDGRYLPNAVFTIVTTYAFGEKPKYDTKKYGAYPELKPVVERRLQSEDYGRTWRVLDWKKLNPNFAPDDYEIKFIKRI